MIIQFKNPMLKLGTVPRRLVLFLDVVISCVFAKKSPARRLFAYL